MSSHNEISKVAYELYERSGRVEGLDLEHWCEAEKIVIEARKNLPAEKALLNADNKGSSKKTVKQRPAIKNTVKKQSKESASETDGKISRGMTAGKQVPKSRTPRNRSPLKKNG